MPSDVSEDTSPTESTMLELDSPKIAGGGKPDKEGGALVIPAKAAVGENKIIDTRLEIMRRTVLNKPNEAKEGQNRVLQREEWLSKKKNQRKHKRAVKTPKIILS